MNNKSKSEQVFILLLVLTGCFILFIIAGCSFNRTPLNSEDTIYSCGSCDKDGCQFTWGTAGGKLSMWHCGTSGGCLGCWRCSIGYAENEDGEAFKTLGLGCCDSSFLCYGTNCDDATCVTK